MDVLIPIQCSDGIVEINYDDIINCSKYWFFRTSLKYKKSICKKTDDHYIYKIPKLEVGCSKEIFNALNNGGVSVDIIDKVNFNTNVDIVEFIYYNTLYKMTKIGYRTCYGFNAKEHQPVFFFIEEYFPNATPYDIIDSSFHSFFDGIFDYNMRSSKFELNEKRVFDIIEWIGKYYNYYGEYSNCDSSGYTLCRFFKFMINCFEQNYFDFFKENHKGNIELLKQSWDKMVEYSIKYPTISKYEIKVIKKMKNYKEVVDYVGIIFKD